MKTNISLALNALLIVAVLILFIDRFSGSKKEDPTQKSDSTKVSGEIVYVNIDSLLDGYDLFNELKTELIKKQQSLETNLASKYKSLERKSLELQQKYEKRLITTADAQKEQEKLMVEQQNFMQMKEKMNMELLEDEQKMNRQIYDSIRTYLLDYNKSKNYKFIISNTTGGTLLVADETLNITDIVKAALNSRHNKSTK